MLPTTWSLKFPGTAVPIPTFPANVSTYSWLVFTAKLPAPDSAILRLFPAAGVTVKAPDDVRLLPDKFSVPAITFVPALFALSVPVNIVFPVTFSVDPSVTAPPAFNVPFTSSFAPGIEEPTPTLPLSVSTLNISVPFEA